ncbi:MAG: 50S ribosomal protein L4 [Actinomycetota bacterium]|nr:50S ribosomal protein L4 [Actinomycetota bacterium]
MMANTAVAPKKVAKPALDPEIFGIEPNVSVMHQVVTAQLAARRAGTQSTRTRAEVAGGGAKPWRQKGTGRARQGSIRAPHWRGGGVALGPKPRSYRQRTPKKMVRLALRSALSDRAAEQRVVVVDDWGWNEPSTKSAKAALASLGVEGRVLVVLGKEDEAVWKSFRNLPEIHCLQAGELNTYDVLVNDWVVFTSETLPTGSGAETAAAKPAAKKPAAAPAEPTATTEADEPVAAESADADDTEEASE